MYPPYTFWFAATDLVSPDLCKIIYENFLNFYGLKLIKVYFLSLPEVKLGTKVQKQRNNISDKISGIVQLNFEEFPETEVFIFK